MCDIIVYQDYSVDEKKFRALPGVLECAPPEEFLLLTFLCCQTLPVKRPDFTELRHKLEMELNSQSLQSSPGLVTQPPQPHRLSSHSHNHLLLHNLSPSARETPV
jgi:hypothetical protein